MTVAKPGPKPGFVAFQARSRGEQLLSDPGAHDLAHVVAPDPVQNLDARYLPARVFLQQKILDGLLVHLVLRHDADPDFLMPARLRHAHNGHIDKPGVSAELAL